jgi:hypothetical protein
MDQNNINYNLEKSPVGLGLRKITQTIKYTEFVDAGGAIGNLTLANQLPAGAILQATRVTVTTAFTGNTSCVLTAGKSSGEDEFTDGTSINIYTAGVKGDSMEDPNEFLAAAGSDWGLVTAGELVIDIYYLSTVVELINNS